MKICYFDTETTGMDPVKNDIIQLSGIIEIDGVVKEKFNLRIKPTDMSSIDPGALAVNGISRAQLETYPDPKEQYLALTSMLGKYVDKFSRMDKFCPAGFNVRFDIDFLKSFFQKNGDPYFGSYFNYRAIDPLAVLYFMDGFKPMSLENFKLSTVAQHYGVSLNAHDAMSDIEATREIIQLLRETLRLL